MIAFRFGRAHLIRCDVRHPLPLADSSVHCVVTSPPYWGLRDYNDPRQIGLEATYPEYVARMVALFRELRRVLRDDGVAWLNLGDSYAGSGMTGGTSSKDGGAARVARMFQGNRRDAVQGVKPKDLVGIPWRVALALQDDGWYLRSDVIWSKPNPMPESIRDRPTKAHEYVFLLTKRERYFYDADAERTEHVRPWDEETNGRGLYGAATARPNKHNDLPVLPHPAGANLRTVWLIPTAPYPGAHFATFPPSLPARCIRLGTSERGCCPACGAPWRRVVERGELVLSGHPRGKGAAFCAQRAVNGEAIYRRERTSQRWEPSCPCDAGDPIPCVVLDPFSGSGTTAAVARELGRVGIGLEVNPEYLALASARVRRPAITRDNPSLAESRPPAPMDGQLSIFPEDR